jgi:TatA/E family protein of Tat protein translocase
MNSYIFLALKFEKKEMFGSIGFPELLVILTIALLIFGPKKLPEVGKSIGKALREFRRTSDEIKDKIEEEIQAEDFRDIKKGETETKKTGQNNKEEIKKGTKGNEEGKKVC